VSIQAGGTVLPGIGDQRLGRIEADAHRATAQVPALHQGEQDALFPFRLEIGAHVVAEPDGRRVVVLTLARRVRAMIGPVDPETGDVVLVPEFLEPGAQDRLGLQNPKGPGKLLVAGAGGEGAADGPEHAAVSAGLEGSAGAERKDLLDLVIVANLAGAGVVDHPLAGAVVRHMRVTLVLGELGLDAAVGEAGGNLLEVVQHIVGLGPEGIIGHVGA
jgi:hypothetical protein